MGEIEAGQAAPTIIRPQPGPQTTFLASAADIAIYGGSAGGGKTWAHVIGKDPTTGKNIHCFEDQVKKEHEEAKAEAGQS